MFRAAISYDKAFNDKFSHVEDMTLLHMHV